MGLRVYLVSVLCHLALLGAVVVRWARWWYGHRARGVGASRSISEALIFSKTSKEGGGESESKRKEKSRDSGLFWRPVAEVAGSNHGPTK